jgi:hypothetical protein
MRRYGRLWGELIGFPNLLRAARKAERGKRARRLQGVPALHGHVSRPGRKIDGYVGSRAVIGFRAKLGQLLRENPACRS